ncbi:hypothetical protein JCM9279_004037 [Rhodotorula babjevae]
MSSQVHSPSLDDPAHTSSEAQEILPPLLRLPNELLEIILAQAYSSPLPPDNPRAPGEDGLVLAHKPLCKQLWPIQEALVYRRMRINSYEQLVALKGALVGTRHLGGVRPGSLVRALVVDTNDCQQWLGPGGADDQEGPGVPEGAARHLAEIFGELGELRSLEVDLRTIGLDDSRSSRVERALLAVIVHDRSTPASLSRLKSLRIASYGKNLDSDPVGEADDLAAWMDQFSRFPNLGELYIDLETERPPSFALPESHARPVLSNLSRLEVRTNFERWVEPLRDVAPRLVDLRICATGYSLRPIIVGLPPSLLRLDIAGDEEREDIDDLLPPLGLLQSLSFNTKCYKTTRLPTSLGNLHDLATLEFDVDAEATDTLLAQLVDAPTRLKCLRQLRVDVFPGGVGPTLLRQQLVLPGASERDGSGLWPGWLAPKWPAGASEAGLRRVIDVARTHGVRVSGWGLLCLGWDAAHERERDVVAVCRGLSTDDWVDARRFRGDEVVDKFLARREREGRRRSLGRELDLVADA